VDLLLILAMNGLVFGLIVALIALGLSIIFGLLDIINVAHGDFFMVGTVLAWVIVTCVYRKPHPFDCVAESHNVSANGRADILLAEHGCLALQVEEPA
jgi:branched-subunit amino acid ABC-type transport system permease component